MFKNLTRTILLVTSLLISFNSLSEAKETHLGTHGMLMFGGSDGLFASHLPMFHVPHNVQVVFQFHFADTEIDQVVREQLQSNAHKNEQVWTIVPTRFDLVRLDVNHPTPLTTLTVDIVKGHFERGGETQFLAQELVIDKLLIFNRLDTKADKNKAIKANVNYVVISASEDSVNQFLIKSLGNRPEADHLVRVHNKSGLPFNELTVKSGLSLFVSDSELTEQLNQRVTQQSVRAQTLYLETLELQ